MVINERLINENANLLRLMGFALSPWNQSVCRQKKRHFGCLNTSITRIVDAMINVDATLEQISNIFG